MGLATFAFPVCVGVEVTCILEFFSTTSMAPGKPRNSISPYGLSSGRDVPRAAEPLTPGCALNKLFAAIRYGRP